MQKLVSIVIPTSNRGKILRESLPLLAEQVKRNSDFVELIVCDNASSDDTVKILDEMREQDPFFSLVHYDKREEDIGASIARAAENGSGEYIHFWGDDDIPSPFMVDAVLRAIKKYHKIGCLMMNRIQSWAGMYSDKYLPVSNLFVLRSVFSSDEILFDSSEEFIYDTAKEVGFLGAYVVRRDVWQLGVQSYDKNQFGYQFLTPIFAGLKGERCLYLNHPFLIQRLFGKTRYAKYWPLYLYLGLPRVYKKLEAVGVIGDWHRAYYGFRYPENTRCFISDILKTCLPNREVYMPFVKEMCTYQQSKVRKAILHLICAPTWIVLLFKLAYWLLAESILGRVLFKVARYVGLRLKISHKAV